jgi:REP element-mobilizing transposase RayT
MKQLNLISAQSFRKEHGGALSIGRRRSRRPLSTKEALHITLRSELATKERSLLRHRPLIEAVIRKASRRFRIRVYRWAVCRNHIHLLIKGKRREDLQNFFRVLAGHIAQGILKLYPLKPHEVGGALTHQAGGAPRGRKKGCVKNQRKFWDLLLYSRVLTWGREFKAVTGYLVQNTLEALKLIAYAPRKTRFSKRLHEAFTE